MMSKVDNSSKNRSLQWELDWIEKNKCLYDSDLHASAVKGNIEKRYRIRELESELRKHEVHYEQ